jgi:hypothetical protein
MTSDDARCLPRGASSSARSTWSSGNVDEKAQEIQAIERLAEHLRTGLEPLCGEKLRGWDSNPQPIG